MLEARTATAAMRYNIISLGTICVHNPNAKPAITFCGGETREERSVFRICFVIIKGRFDMVSTIPIPIPIAIIEFVYVKRKLFHRQTQTQHTYPLYLLFSNFVRPTKIKYISCILIYISGCWFQHKLRKTQIPMNLSTCIRKVFVHKLFFVEHSPIIQSKILFSMS